MNTQSFTLRIDHPAAAGPAATASLLFKGRCETFWHRPLWLHPAFWEVHGPDTPKTLASANRPAPGRRLSIPTSIWVGLRLGAADRGWTIQAAGQTTRPPGGVSLREPLAFPLTDGQINLPPFHIRLPPGLQFHLTWDIHDRLHLDMGHRILGSIFSTRVHPTTRNTTKEPLPC